MGGLGVSYLLYGRSGFQVVGVGGSYLQLRDDLSGVIGPFMLSQSHQRVEVEGQTCSHRCPWSCWRGCLCVSLIALLRGEIDPYHGDSAAAMSTSFFIQGLRGKPAKAGLLKPLSMGHGFFQRSPDLRFKASIQALTVCPCRQTALIMILPPPVHPALAQVDPSHWEAISRGGVERTHSRFT